MCIYGWRQVHVCARVDAGCLGPHVCARVDAGCLGPQVVFKE